MGTMYVGERPDAVNEITQLALEFRLMSPYASFVAVEEKVVNEGGKTRTVQVPVEMPESVSYEGVFGDHGAAGTMVQLGPVRLRVGGGGGYGGGGMMGPGGGGHGGVTLGTSLEFSSGPAGPAGPAGAPGMAGAGMMGGPGPGAMGVGLGGGPGRTSGADAYGALAWIGVLAERGATAAPDETAGLVTALTAARSVIHAPNAAPCTLTPEALSTDAGAWSVSCLVVSSAVDAETLAPLRDPLDAGLWLLVDGQDALRSVLAADLGIETSVVHLGHPLLTGEGTAYDVGRFRGVLLLKRNGEVMGIALPGLLAGLKDGITEENDLSVKLAINVLSFVLQRGVLSAPSQASTAIRERPGAASPEGADLR